MVSSIKRILIANRGEIALRVMRTCAEQNIESVAVHSTQDAGALHVRTADIAVDLGPGPSSENYLNIPKIIAAALEHGVDAIHPGYGFLSENAAFAAAVADAGIIFIGPSAGAIQAMGEKVAARQAAIAAEVPVVPGSDGPIVDVKSAAEFGETHGYPLLIKASFGGGGRGMRLVEEASALAASIDAARREATSAFGNGEVYLERYLGNARHVEVQIIGDTLGNVIWLGDRDCSAQRRHQKVIEESPAPGLSDALRHAMGEASVRLAKTVDYVGAGTVEYLVEGDSFYFLEMNTRIQVEHPVTEEVLGLDIVREQIQVAAGEKLSVAESGPAVNGAAVEARINAEDFADGRFLPAPGHLDQLVPPTGAHIRFDAGYEQGDTVQADYDSLIGKLIAWGATREEALDRLDAALGELLIDGVPTTAGVARSIVRQPAFREARISTVWLESAVQAGDVVDESDALERDEVIVGGRYFRIPNFAVTSVVASPGVVTQTATTTRRSSGGTRRTGSVAAFDGTVRSPMQGTIVKVSAAEGDHVDKGDLLFVLEAMKMENPITAPVAGILESVSVIIGSTIAAGDAVAGLKADN